MIYRELGEEVLPLLVVGAKPAKFRGQVYAIDGVDLLLVGGRKIDK